VTATSRAAPDGANPMTLVMLRPLASRDEDMGTAMGLLTGSWLAVGQVTVTARPGATSGGLGLLLVGSATALLVPAMAAATSKPLGTTVISTTALRLCPRRPCGTRRRLRRVARRCEVARGNCSKSAADRRPRVPPDPRA
jgi:hypothetical protein